MVSSVLVYNIHLSHPFNSSGLHTVTLEMTEVRLGARSVAGFTCPSAYRLMLSHKEVSGIWNTFLYHMN